MEQNDVMGERQEPIYVITEPIRQALLAVVVKAIHPTISFDQINSLKEHLISLQPVPGRVTQGPPPQERSVPDDVRVDDCKIDAADIRIARQ